MADLTLFIGLDVHKKTISVAIVEASGGAPVRFYGTIANTPDSLRTLCRKLSRSGEQLHFCYEDLRLRRAAPTDPAGTPVRCGGAGANPAQGRR